MAEPTTATPLPDNHGCTMHTEWHPTCGTCNGYFNNPTNLDRYDPNQPKIKGITCPACGSHDTIFIGGGGYLTCSWIECPEPTLDDAIKLAIAIECDKARIDELEHIPGVRAHENKYIVDTSDITDRIAQLKAEAAQKGEDDGNL